MANSIFGNSPMPQSPQPSFDQSGQPNNEMLQQFQNFRQTFHGNPQQTVMQMLSQGRISNNQLQQAMAMARQFQHMFK